MSVAVGVAVFAVGLALGGLVVSVRHSVRRLIRTGGRRA